MHKKASLNMAIEVIVIVVIAMTLLGLGLGFVRNQFSSITETTITVQEQIKNQILDDLRVGNKKLSFPQTSLSVETGDFKDVAIGVKNQKSLGPLEFEINFAIEGIQETGRVSDEELENQIDFFYSSGPFELQQAEAEVYPVRITADEGTKGTYLVRVSVNEIIDDEGSIETYAERTFFVNII